MQLFFRIYSFISIYTFRSFLKLCNYSYFTLSFNNLNFIIYFFICCSKILPLKSSFLVEFLSFLIHLFLIKFLINISFKLFFLCFWQLLVLSVLFILFIIYSIDINFSRFNCELILTLLYYYS